MNQREDAAPLAHAAGQTYLTLFARGQGIPAAGFVVDSATGFALWYEGAPQCVRLVGHRQARLVMMNGLPHVDISEPLEFSSPAGDALAAMRIPCLEIIGLAALDDEIEAYRDELAHERTNRSLH